MQIRMNDILSLGRTNIGRLRSSTSRIISKIEKPANNKMTENITSKSWFKDAISKGIYNIKIFFNKYKNKLICSIEAEAYKLIYFLQSKSLERIPEISELCKSQKRTILGKVNVKNKKNGKIEEAFLTIRKIDKDQKYSTLDSPFILDSILNDIIDSRIKRSITTPPSDDVVKNHNLLSDKSYMLELLKSNGEPLGFHFLDIRSHITEGKGLYNFARKTYGGVGSILTEIKALSAAITGSMNVHTIGSWDSMPFHLKSGYKIFSGYGKCTHGNHIYMPEENIQRIQERYKNTDIYANLSRILEQRNE